MMTMYSISQIKELQKNGDYLKQEEEKYCLVSLEGKTLTNKDVENQCNFCVLQILNAYKKDYISPKKANDLINMVETFEYTTDLLGVEKTISKLNKEIITDNLNTPFFNSLCVLCEDLYDIFI